MDIQTSSFGTNAQSIVDTLTTLDLPAPQPVVDALATLAAIQQRGHDLPDVARILEETPPGKIAAAMDAYAVERVMGDQASPTRTAFMEAALRRIGSRLREHSLTIHQSLAEAFSVAVADFEPLAARMPRPLTAEALVAAGPDDVAAHQELCNVASRMDLVRECRATLERSVGGEIQGRSGTVLPWVVIENPSHVDAAFMALHEHRHQSPQVWLALRDAQGATLRYQSPPEVAANVARLRSAGRPVPPSADRGPDPLVDAWAQAARRGAVLV